MHSPSSPHEEVRGRSEEDDEEPKAVGGRHRGELVEEERDHTYVFAGVSGECIDALTGFHPALSRSTTRALMLVCPRRKALDAL